MRAVVSSHDCRARAMEPLISIEEAAAGVAGAAATGAAAAATGVGAEEAAVAVMMVKWSVRLRL